MKNGFFKKLLFLSLGTLFFFYGNGNIHYAIATWIFSIFLLEVSRKSNEVVSYVIIPLLLGITSHFSFWKFIPSQPNDILYYVPFLLGLFYGFAFWVDRFLYTKTTGIKATLIFPLSYTSLDFLVNLFSPLGTTGVLGYSQIEFLSFSQLASLTGMWGLTFFVTWFGSIAVWAFTNFNAHKKETLKGLAIYSALLALILIYGISRSNFDQNESFVKIAGLHTNDKSEDIELWSRLRNKDTIGFKKLSNLQIKELLEKTNLESTKGAKIIVWSEISLQILEQDQDSLTSIFKSMAQSNDIYLLTNPFVIQNKNTKSENKIMLFSPNGELMLEQYKYGGNFLEGTKEGVKKLSSIKTKYGNLTGLICWDADFPSTVKQINQLGTDILLVPASDWKEIDPLHTIIAVFRGIENGCSVVRQTRNGLSIMTDQYGREITKMDHFKTNEWTMSGEVPTKRVWTLYSVIGDLFGWMALIGLVTLILIILRKKNTAPNKA